MQVSFTAHAPNHSMLTITATPRSRRLHQRARQRHQRQHTTLQAYEEGKQLMEARYGRFDAMKEARHINPYRDGDR